eukprot:gene12934-biopygen5108
MRFATLSPTQMVKKRQRSHFNQEKGKRGSRGLLRLHGGTDSSTVKHGGSRWHHSGITVGSRWNNGGDHGGDHGGITVRSRWNHGGDHGGITVESRRRSRWNHGGGGDPIPNRDAVIWLLPSPSLTGGASIIN